MAAKVFPIRLSHSSLELLNTCERKFELEKLLGAQRERDSEHFSFGHSYGAGVANYMVTHDKTKALFAAWQAYWPVVESDTKTEMRALLCVQQSFIYLDSILMEYEVASFHGAPATELSFKLNITKDIYFVGHIDVVLRHRTTKRYCVMEVKHTGLSLIDIKPLYENSGQALGYSIALDEIAGKEQSDYGVLYLVAQLGKNWATKTHKLEFPKTLSDRLHWFITLGLDVQRIEEMKKLGIFPKRGSSCIKFNKVCKHFGICGLTSFDRETEPEPDEIVYTFEYDLDSLIDHHLERIAQ